MNHEEEADPTRLAFREFDLACQSERNRLACAQQDEEGRRFESSRGERAVAEIPAARLVATLTR